MPSPKENTATSTATSTTKPKTDESATKLPLLQRAKNAANEFGNKLQNPEKYVLNRAGFNKANEDAETQSLANKSKAGAAEDFEKGNWKPGEGSETLQMAKYGQRAMQLGRQLKAEYKQLEEDRKNPKKPGTDVVVEEKSTTTEQNEKKQTLGQQLEDLGKVMATEDVTNREKEWANYLEKYDLPAEKQNFNEHVLDVVKEYREVTGEKYQAPSQDIEQDPISALEDYAKTSLGNQKNLDSITTHEKEAAKVPAEIEKVAEEVSSKTFEKN